MKIINKSFINERGKIAQMLTERKVLSETKCPFIVSLNYAFQSANDLHLLLDFCPGGELFFHLHKLRYFTEA